MCKNDLFQILFFDQKLLKTNILDSNFESGGVSNVVVVATHGHSDLRHILLGSVAEAVVRKAPCNVLVVRGRS